MALTGDDEGDDGGRAWVDRHADAPELDESQALAAAMVEHGTHLDLSEVIERAKAEGLIASVDEDGRSAASGS